MLDTPMTPDEVMLFLDEVFPQIHQFGRIFSIEETGASRAVMRMKVSETNLRPGNTISGPAIFTLCDLAVYAALLGTLGKEDQAVTTNLNLNFLRRAPMVDLLGDAKLIKVGRRLVVAEVGIHTVDSPDLIAHATATYARPG